MVAPGTLVRLEQQRGASHGDPISRRKLREVWRIRAEEEELGKCRERSAEQHQRAERLTPRGGVGGMQTASQAGDRPNEHRDENNHWQIGQYDQSAGLEIARIYEILPGVASQNVAVPE